MTIKEQFDNLGPWICKFIIEGVDSGGNWDSLHDVRVNKFLSMFPDIKTVLEFGSLEGGHTAAIAQYPGIELVTGLESRDANIAKCKFIHKQLNIKNSNFILCNVEDTDLKQFGKFDAIFCSGVLYHLPDPIKLLRQFKGITNIVLLGTHYSKDLVEVVNGMEGSWYLGEQGVDDVLSGMSPKSFWLTLEYLQKIIKEEKFNILSLITHTDNPNGPWVDIIMERKT